MTTTEATRQQHCTSDDCMGWCLLDVDRGRNCDEIRAEPLPTVVESSSDRGAHKVTAQSMATSLRTLADALQSGAPLPISIGAAEHGINGHPVAIHTYKRAEYETWIVALGGNISDSIDVEYDAVSRTVEWVSADGVFRVFILASHDGVS